MQYLSSLFERRLCHFYVSTKRRRWSESSQDKGCLFAGLAASFGAGIYLTHRTRIESNANNTISRAGIQPRHWHLLRNSNTNKLYISNNAIFRQDSSGYASLLVSIMLAAITTNRTSCDADVDDSSFFDDDDELSTGITESERFYQCLEYHRSLLSDYSYRWGTASSEKIGMNSGTTIWPRNMPTAKEFPALELDYRFCKRQKKDNLEVMKRCQNQLYIIACYCLRENKDSATLQKGYKLVKELAEQGHPNGMYMYAKIKNDGLIPGVEAKPEEAVIWWRRCVDDHGHIKAMYELAIALYTGEGVVEDPELAARLFKRAANLGHAGAAYMLGECLLDGVGAERDRADALEWLVTAAELGHNKARNRVIVILNQEYEHLDAGHGNTQEARKQEEAMKWVNAEDEERVRESNIERRFTIGGGSRNPKISARRMSKVKESRDEPTAGDCINREFGKKEGKDAT